MCKKKMENVLSTIIIELPSLISSILYDDYDAMEIVFALIGTVFIVGTSMLIGGYFGYHKGKKKGAEETKAANESKNDDQKNKSTSISDPKDPKVIDLKDPKVIDSKAIDWTKITVVKK